MQCLSGYLTSQARSMRCGLSRAASLLVPMPAPASSAWATSRISVGCDLPGPRQAQLDGWHFHANVWSPCTITTAWSGSVAIFSVLRWPDRVRLRADGRVPIEPAGPEVGRRRGWRVEVRDGALPSRRRAGGLCTGADEGPLVRSRRDAHRDAVALLACSGPQYGGTTPFPRARVKADASGCAPR
jgi:hypothetical protein